MNEPVRVAVTGAAGQIGYSLLFRIAAGDMLGPDQPVILQLLEVTPALKALSGVVMELNDGAFPLLHGIVTSDDPMVAFKDADYALLVGAMPRKAGMERGDLLSANGGIFKPQGEALSEVASRRRQGVGGRQPGQHQRPDRPAKRPQARRQTVHGDGAPRPQPRHLAARRQNRRAGQRGQEHHHLGQPQSSTQYPDLSQATVNGQPALEQVDQNWYETEYIPTVAKRGAAIIEARGNSSAASAASAAIDHMRDWALGTREGEWVSMGIPSDGSYGIPEGLIYGFPVTVKDGQYSIVPNLPVSDFSRSKMDATAQELTEERDAVRELGLVK